MREQDAGPSIIGLSYGLDAASGNPAIHTNMSVGAGLLASRILERAGICERHRTVAARAALANNSDLASELVAALAVDEETLADAMAAELRLPRGTIPPGLVLAEITGRASSRILRTVEATSRVVVAPRLEDVDSVADFLAAHPHLVKQVRIATRSQIDAARAARTSHERSETARLSLSRDRPMVSARHTMTGWQGFAAALLLVALVVVWLAPTTLPILRIVLLPIYLACIALRFGAALRLQRHRLDVPAIALDVQAEPPPRYSVLVALRDEKRDTIAQLVASLSRLRWPCSRLEIFMVCEADDTPTVEEVRQAIRGLPCFRLVEVPPSLPRTKPKALNFALPLAKGAFVALFDAEDRPHPEQLRAAWAAFRAGGERLACVQAPLVVTNGDRNWLAAHFALEYAALFRGLLPFLAERDLPLPLGGTSNHFRREALAAVDGWDSHNVAEDADLGIRLARHGFRTGVIDTPTLEEAPERWRDWRNQRTRWMKGWCQTWLVHMRQPLVLLRQLGLRRFVAFQMLFAGMLLSSILNTVLLAILVVTALSFLVGGWPSDAVGALLMLDLATLLLGYGVYAALATGACRRNGHGRDLLRHLWTLPSYWLLISVATLRALWHLAFKPQLWEKTPHGREARLQDGASTPERSLPVGDPAVLRASAG